MPASVTEKRTAFRELHQSGCFVMPNPWDIGSARYLASLGFKALASTSSGMAWARGQADNRVGCEAVLAHLAELATATDLPLNADFEGGYADTPEGVAANVRRAVATGIAGLSIEDSTGEAAAPLRPIGEAVARIAAARAAIDAAGGGVLLTGRAENFIADRPDLSDTVARLQAYAAAGADCLYAPGLRRANDIAAVVKAVAPKPVNILMGTPLFTVAELTAMGVRRISVGGALARAAWGGFAAAARKIAEHGSFEALAHGTPGRELNNLFG